MAEPAREYRQRLAARNADADRLRVQIDRLGQWRLGLFLFGLAIGIAGITSGQFAGWWGFAVLGPIAVLFLAKLRLAERLAWFERLARYYEQGLRKVTNQWVGTGTTGQRFIDAGHLAAVDLDLFGRGSLFERICTARTAGGEDRLASWFLTPSTAAIVCARQRAIADLRDRLDLREGLAAAGADVAASVEYTSLANWGHTDRPAPANWRETAILVLGFANMAALLAWLGFGISSLLLLLTLGLSAFIVVPIRRWVMDVAAPVEDAARTLGLLRTILARFEAEVLTADLLVDLQRRLRAENRTASAQLGDLASLADWLSARRNAMFLPFRVLLLWDARMAFRIEAWRRQSGPLIRVWIETVAELEALSSLAAYSYENPADPFPTVTDGPVCFDAIGLGHPLMSVETCVRNDVALGGSSRVMMISGSNMSGKSTLLRAVGVNAVLALAGGPVRATSLALSTVRVVATLRVQDSLLDGRSRFFAEVVRVRASLEAARAGPSLFLFDELFAGTNSADRIRGAAGVIRALLDTAAIGLVTTHDLAVTELPDELRGTVANWHFADQWVNGEMSFDHTMRPGVVPHTNGVALMRAVGLDV